MSAGTGDRTIIVGVDGSERGREALALALVLAGPMQARVLITCVFPHERVPGKAEGGAYERVMREDCARLLADAAAGHDVEHRIVGSSSPARGLHELAEAENALCVVVGSKRGAAAGSISTGSTAERLLHGSPCAVAVPPSGYAGGELHSIGVGYDGSEEAKAALDAAIGLARAAGGSLLVLSAAESLTDLFGMGLRVDQSEFERALEDERRAQLEQALDLAAATVPVAGRLLQGDPARALSRLDDHLPDLLVVGSRGYGRLRQVLLGTVSGRLVRGATVPVLVLPRGARAGLVPAP